MTTRFGWAPQGARLYRGSIDHLQIPSPHLTAPVLYLQHPYRNTHLRREVDLGHRGSRRSITVVEHTQDPGAGAKFHPASNHAYGTLQKHDHQ